MTIGIAHRTPSLTSVTELRRVARRYARNPNLDVLLRDTGERTWVRLADDTGVELWLISWPEGAETGWHDHGGSTGAFAVAHGAVLEETWGVEGGERGVGVRRRRLAEGDSRSFGAAHVHNVRGFAEGRSLTVHAYAPRLQTMTRHELTAQGPRVVGTSDEGAGW